MLMLLLLKKFLQTIKELMPTDRRLKIKELNVGGHTLGKQKCNGGWIFSMN